MSSLAPYVAWLKTIFEGLTLQQKILWGSFTSGLLYGLYIIFRNLVPPKLPLRAVPVLDDKRSKNFAETAARRNVLSPKSLVTEIKKWPDVKTMADLLTKAAKTYPESRCLGYRDLIKIHKEVKEVATKVDGETKMVKKDWYFEERGPYKWLTYKDVEAKVKLLTNALLELGLKEGSRLGIYSNTRFEWQLMAQACFRTNVTVVTVYANLGEEGLAYALEQGELEHIFTSSDLLPIIAKLKPELPTLSTVIYADPAKEDVLESLAQTGLKAVAFDELFNIGKATSHAFTPPSGDDLAVIMYTSGTTGAPKGVMMTHKNLIACVAAVSLTVDIRSTDVYLAMLPLAHVLELVVENCLLSYGAALGYGSTKTLTDATVKNCKGDLTELSPTLMAGVPLIWERIRKATLAKLSDASPIVRGIFWTAYKLRGYYLPLPLIQPILNLLVFNKFKDQLGGRMRLIVSGGAALSKETHEFVRRCFNIPFLQGYGLTETCGASVLLPPDHPGYLIAGAPLPCVELKLRDVPDMGYLATNLPYPRGEVCIRGPTVAQGYYKLREQTLEAFGEDGWFATGDVGEFRDDGTLAIIDRKKNLVKLAHGEYIALEKMENRYKDSVLVENVCVYGDSNREYPVALVVPNRVALQKWADEKKIPHDSIEHLIQSKEAQKHLLEAIVAAARKAHLKEIEIVKSVALVTDEWTPDNNLLTAAMKLQRAKIYAKYKDLIEQLYSN